MSSPRAVLAVTFLWLVAVGLVDQATPPVYGLSYFYLPAVAFATWHSGRRIGVGVALAATLVWYLADSIGVDFPGSFARVWNAGIRFAFFATVVALLDTLRATVARQDALITELQATLAEVRTLRGLVPICAWCKKVRDDEGYWATVESFIEAHTDAAFTHGVCPDCGDRLRATKATAPASP
ncbi:MAG: hypothetical protein R3F39_16320 [Myxococcota bacterium]